MPPAVTIIVPVMRRPANAEQFMVSLLDTTDPGDVTVTVVADECDDATWKAWLQQLPKGAGRVFRSIWPDPGGSFAQKVNHGYRMSPWTRWLFICGDDVRFHDGWLTNALGTAVDAKVIGTSAKGASDTWSPHLFISRSYVDGEGASWDGFGYVCHEGYRHNYVDVEICAVACQRDVYYTAWDAEVEHLHPFFGLGSWDPVYKLGQDWVDADAAVWNQRRELYA